MLLNNCTKKILNLQDVIITNVKHEENTMEIHIKIPVKTHSCPSCGKETKYIHDYRKQVIKDISAFGKDTILIYNKRRYRCPHCGKCFFESNSFLPKYHRVTSRLVANIIDKLREVF